MTRVLKVGQHFGMNNRLVSITKTEEGEWSLKDEYESTFSQSEYPDGMHTWDEPHNGGDTANRELTPWPND